MGAPSPRKKILLLAKKRDISEGVRFGEGVYGRREGKT